MKKKKNLLKEIHRIDEKLARGCNNHLSQLKQKKWKDYEGILQMEEVLWF